MGADWSQISGRQRRERGRKMAAPLPGPYSATKTLALDVESSSERASCYRIKVIHRTGCAPPVNSFPWRESLGLAECQNSLLYSKRSSTEGGKLESLKGVWDRVKNLHKSCCTFCGKSLLEIAKFQIGFYSKGSMEGIKIESLQKVCRRIEALRGTFCSVCGEAGPRITVCHKRLYSKSSMEAICDRTFCSFCGGTGLGANSFFSEPSMEGMKLESLERACDRAKARHDLFTWGEALLEIAECQNSLSSKRQFINDAIEKLHFGLFRNGSDHHANWCLGKAYVACGLASPDRKLAYQHFFEASSFFKKAVSLDPCNEKYKLSLHLPREAERGPNGIFENRYLVEKRDGVKSALSFLGVLVALSATLLFQFRLSDEVGS